MIKFLIALTLLFAAPSLSFAKSPKCPKGDKACAKKAKKDKKADKKKHSKKDKKKDKVAKNKKKVKNLDMPAENASAAPSPAASGVAPSAKKGEEDDIFPESTSSSAPAPAPEGGAPDDFVDDQLPAE